MAASGSRSIKETDILDEPQKSLSSHPHTEICSNDSTTSTLDKQPVTTNDSEEQVSSNESEKQASSNDSEKQASSNDSEKQARGNDSEKQARGNDSESLAIAADTTNEEPSNPEESTVEIGDFLFHVSENEIKPQIPPAEVDNTDSSEDNQKRKKTKKKAASKKRKSSKVKYRDDQEGFELFPSDENDGDSSGPQKKRRKSHAKQKSSKKSSTSSIKFSRKSEVSDMMKRVKKKLGDSSEQTPEASNSGYGWDSLRDSGSFKRRGSGSGWGSASRWGNASSRLRQQWGSRDNATSTKSGWNRSRETLQPRISRHESSPGRAFDRNAPAPAWAVQRDNSKFRGSGNLDRENQPETGWSGMVNNTAAPRTWNSGSAAPTVVYDNRPQSEWGREMQGSTGRSAQSGNSGQLGGSRLESSRWRSQNEFAPNAKPSPSSSPFNQNYGTPLSVGNVTSGWNQRAGPPSQQGGSSQQSSYFQQYAQPMTAVHGSQPLYNSQDDRLTAQSQQPYSFPLADASHVELQTPIPSQPGAWAASINLSQMTEQVRRPSSSASKETSSKMDERARDNLKKQISKFVIQTLSPYLKQGKITSKDDFKFLARKFTQKFLRGEEKANRPFNDKVKGSITKYLEGFFASLPKGTYVKKP